MCTKKKHTVNNHTRVRVHDGVVQSNQSDEIARRIIMAEDKTKAVVLSKLSGKN